ncbi:glucose-6-phosphate dehydrogenase assembly protein OpcA [Corynebacterium glucuronolyticum]|uniref:Glucose-6-phosphate dehydrogenase assembly protein OpcA n=2 Tax=Corynebacterium glucuronolyticum TaxID=39791 RepID=A0A7T4EE43_9CORY|nr:glucose-6-phosphate dehydrogenase assembly protein OpcA [Corynebacterium glucuronolyticum]EEI26595.1 putative opcA protein [Corynebacterium glucuronolyticum ATCC 51867]EEI62945.1 putative opcA protein [Corynebacterium glucuronolyticum ATCC 51866]MCT1442882.1 glucose-6-phosphate dehydrogenase assembly protein OpcA [Corynebacterium glucuronolyticum]QQB45697.1 glucose-6-phosphate dehydrogenase assembly protein OpcA [Corynebacterium glucuronolyticum]QQU89546.1 glucose-6-phosphate dehydrogenase 
MHHLRNTSTREISSTIEHIEASGMQPRANHVLTLIVVIHGKTNKDKLFHTISSSSKEHPSRVLILEPQEEAHALGVHPPSVIDAELHVGGDAGASEIIWLQLRGEVTEHLDSVVTPLLLPDTPIVAWWPASAPVNPAEDPIGRLATRRITDSFYDPAEDAIYRRRSNYTPGDSDLCWSRLTPWRGILASALDQPPFEQVKRAKLYGLAVSPTVDLAAGWLADVLGVPVFREVRGSADHPVDRNGLPAIPVAEVILERETGTVRLTVADAETIELTIGDGPVTKIAQGRRPDVDCLSEEMRHLVPDQAYAGALNGLSKVTYLEAD